ncbi:MAG TPA: type I-U CRISPR-associated protein Csb2 [Gammaproteobacteria bacterium]|nr:type I-U CRISPR-associated protein Csb2 [Gammaproteobacteria bacterium]
MLAFGIRYLNGFVAATEPDDLECAEWPPHPGRIFMALAAAHFQTGADPTEREALLWLDGSTRGGEISPPQIAVPDAMQRAIVKHYVPVNDKSGPAKAVLHSLPITRDRQDRTFTRAWLQEDTAYCLWPDLDPPKAYRQALAQLCAKVTRIGHSSSLVQMWLAGKEEIVAPNWLPDETRATLRLRIAGPGTLEYLEREYNAMAVEDYANLEVATKTASNDKDRKRARNQLKERYADGQPPQQRPRLSLYHGYARAGTQPEDEAVPGSLFSPHYIALRLEREDSAYRALDLLGTLNIVKRWREALISQGNDASDRIRSLISGHSPDGKPLGDPHAAFMPQPFIGTEHAAGHLLGLGLALPEEVTRDERRELLKVIARARRLKLGPLGLWRLDAVTESSPPWNLRPDTWTAWPQGATQWSTVTPIAFDRHSKAKNQVDRQREQAAMIAKGCERTGLPAPREVIVTPVSAHLGVPPAHAFPKLKRKDGGERRHTHAILVFDEPVCGPVLIGAGRFRGYGVCRAIGFSEKDAE